MIRFVNFTVLIVLFAFTASDAQTTYPVTLSGMEQVPSVRTAASGTAEVYVESDTLYVSGTFSDLSGHYWAAFVHYGAEGEEGNRMFRLTAELNEEKDGGTFSFEENKFHLRELQREALREGNLYINISSDRYQEGEIRGQIPNL